jgi:hypothetical protein
MRWEGSRGKTNATSKLPCTSRCRSSSEGLSGLSTSTTRLTSVALSGEGKGIERELPGNKTRSARQWSRVVREASYVHRMPV